MKEALWKFSGRFFGDILKELVMMEMKERLGVSRDLKVSGQAENCGTHLQSQYLARG